MMKQKPTIIYENTVAGSFVRRDQPFHSGGSDRWGDRAGSCEKDGAFAGASGAESEGDAAEDVEYESKTAYDLISVYKPKLKWVNIDSLAPNALMKQLYMSLNYDLVKAEHTYGDSRIDFYMEKNGEKFLTEVKGCTLADDLHPGIGLFPDAPTERGVKHLHELTKAAKEGCHTAIAFVIQMNGIHRVLPNETAQTEFKKALVEAAKAGVQVVCYSCHVEADSIKITGVIEDTSRFLNM